MSQHQAPSPAPPGVTPAPAPIPWSAWAFGLSFLASQLVSAGRRGLQQVENWPLSILLGVVLVVWISHGVMRARPIRFGFVVLLMALALCLGLVGIVLDPTFWGAFDWVVAVVQAWLLWTYWRTPWFAWQRTRPEGGPSLVPILSVALLVGVLGGLIGGPETDGVGVGASVGAH